MVVTGAGGYAKELFQIIIQLNPKEKPVFYADMNTPDPPLFLSKFPVISTMEEAREHFDKTDRRFVLGVGNPRNRRMMSGKFQEAGGHLVSVISPHAIIGLFENSIGAGTNIFPHAVIEASNFIGTGCLIHHAAFISHDVRIGDYCEISPSVNILGKVHIGNDCSIGTSAVVLPGVHIGNHVTVGAGAVVTKDIPDNSLAVGIPARVVKSNLPF